MVKSLFTLLPIMVLVSCVAAKNTTTTSAITTPLNQNAPSKWGSNSVFPLTIKLSTSYSGTEATALQSSASIWSTSVNQGVTFFSATTTTSEKSNISDLNALWDNEFGIYKTTVWNSDLPSTALAVTQIFGARRNAGSSNEYVEILHGDILVNYDYYTFSTGSSSGYDLSTVMVHEMGHFIGLYHVTDNAIDTVMHPSISAFSVHRTPYLYDTNNIKTKYSLGGVVSSAVASKPYKAATKEETMNAGVAVKITMELFPSGECVHRMDGVKISSHPTTKSFKK